MVDTETLTQSNTLTVDDIDQIIEGIEEFIIEGYADVAKTWQPYIDKLEASKHLLVATTDLRAALRDFVAMYADLKGAIGPSVRAKIAAAEAAIAKAEGR
jgi:hypothetical protein